MKERKVLMIGAGSSRDLRVPTPLVDIPPVITTLDLEPRHGTDIVWDLNSLPWSIPWWWVPRWFPRWLRRWLATRIEDNSYDEVHGYEVLEHLGSQGDARAFFAHFGEIYRILKPLGWLAGSCPRSDSIWAWGDPSHRRVINEGSFTFLDQRQYAKQVGVTAMSDFRSLWSGDFESDGEVAGVQTTEHQLYFLLRAHKPARA